MTPTMPDPWRAIEPPGAAGAISAMRVDPEGRWDFFWARDLERRRLLVLFFSHEPWNGQLPHPAGLEVCVHEAGDGRRSMLVLALLEDEHKDIFYDLCLDVVKSASDAESEAQALSAAISRTWRWHHLLRGGGDVRLSKEEQKGLIGELIVLERYLLPSMPAFDAVSAWTGPLGAPKDFEVGSVCIEAKARRGTATPFVSISSEFQLDTQGTSSLFLHVVDLAAASESAPQGFTVSDVVLRVGERLASEDRGALEHFESLLSAAGFRWRDDYRDCRWAECSACLYEVVDAFPRLSANSTPLGVTAVRYSVALSACRPFETSEDRLTRSLGGQCIGE